jgi:hypothetical protein
MTTNDKSPQVLYKDRQIRTLVLLNFVYFEAGAEDKAVFAD